MITNAETGVEIQCFYLNYAGQIKHFHIQDFKTSKATQTSVDDNLSKGLYD